MNNKNLDIFYNFYRSNQHLLKKGNISWPAEKILYQLSYEHAEDSIISKQAEDFLEKERVKGSWFKLLNRIKHSFKNPNYYSFNQHESPIQGFRLINSEVAVSWQKDESLSKYKNSEFYIWNLRTFEYKKLQIGINIADLIIINDDFVCVYSDNKSVSNENSNYIDDYDKLIFINIKDGTKNEYYFEAWIISVFSFGIDILIYIYDENTSLSKLISLNPLSQTTRVIDSTCIQHKNSGWPKKITGVFTKSFQFKTRTDGACEKYELQQSFCIKINEHMFLSISNKSMTKWRLKEGKWCKERQRDIRYFPKTYNITIFDVYDERNLIVIEERLENYILLNIDIHTLKISRLRSKDQKVFINTVADETKLFELFGKTYIRLRYKDHYDVIEIDKQDSTYVYLEKSQDIYDFLRFPHDLILIKHNYVITSCTPLYQMNTENFLIVYNNENKRLIFLPENVKDGTSFKDSLVGFSFVANDKVIFWTEKILKLWDITNNTSKLLLYIKSDIHDVIQISEYIVAIIYDYGLTLCNINDLSLKHYRGNFSNPAFFSDHKIISWSRLGIIRLWNLNHGYITQYDEGHTADVLQCKIISKNSAISCSADGTLRFWDLSKIDSKVFNSHGDWVTGFHVLNSESFLSWSNDATIRLWNLKSAKSKVFQGHTKKVEGVYLLSGNHAVSWSQDGIIQLWDLTTGISKVYDEKSEILGFLKINNSLFLSIKNKVINLLQLKDKLSIKSFCNADMSTEDARMEKGILFDNECVFINRSWIDSDTGELFDSNDVYLYNITENLLRVYAGHDSQINDIIRISPFEFMTCSDDHTIRLWNKFDTSPFIFNLHNSPVMGLRLIKNDIIASFSSDGIIAIQDVKNGFINFFKEHKSRIKDILLVNDNNVLSWSSDGTVILWSYNLNFSPEVKCKYFLERISSIEKITSNKFICFLITGEHKIIELQY